MSKNQIKFVSLCCHAPSHTLPSTGSATAVVVVVVVAWVWSASWNLLKMRYATAVAAWQVNGACNGCCWPNTFSLSFPLFAALSPCGCTHNNRVGSAQRLLDLPGRREEGERGKQRRGGNCNRNARSVVELRSLAKFYQKLRPTRRCSFNYYEGQSRRGTVGQKGERTWK